MFTRKATLTFFMTILTMQITAAPTEKTGLVGRQLPARPPGSYNCRTSSSASPFKTDLRKAIDDILKHEGDVTVSKAVPEIQVGAAPNATVWLMANYNNDHTAVLSRADLFSAANFLFELCQNQDPERLGAYFSFKSVGEPMLFFNM